ARLGAPRLEQRAHPRRACRGGGRGARGGRAPALPALAHVFRPRLRLLRLGAMSERKASGTARAVAAMRPEYPAKGSPCHDPYARALAGEDGEALKAALAASFPPMPFWLACRAAHIDGRVRALTRTIDQVVILGAGLDTRAARLAREGVRFFEVDLPASQAEKLEKVRAIEGYPVEAATYVSCDFEREDFLDRLVASGFDVDRPAFFVWEGVTYYLTEEAVRRTLERIASGAHPRSVLIFDFMS